MLVMQRSSTETILSHLCPHPPSPDHCQADVISPINNLSMYHSRFLLRFSDLNSILSLLLKSVVLITLICITSYTYAVISNNTSAELTLNKTMMGKFLISLSLLVLKISHREHTVKLLWLSHQRESLSTRLGPQLTISRFTGDTVLANFRDSLYFPPTSAPQMVLCAF